MWNKLKHRALTRRQQGALQKVSNEHFRTLLKAAPKHLTQPWEKQRFIVADLETTGLDPAHDDLVSLGWVSIVDGRIRLNDARRVLVRSQKAMNKSATIHGLRDQDLDEGIALEEAMIKLIKALTGGVLVVHYAGLDKTLLDRLCMQQFGQSLLVPIIDTIPLARHYLRHENLQPSQFRLSALNKRFNLPPISQHDALHDAVSTAQLFLALTSKISSGHSLSTFDLMH